MYNLNKQIAIALRVDRTEREAQETAQELSDNGFALRGGLHCAPLVHERLDTLDIGGVRFSPGTFNTQAEAVYFINTVKKIIKNHTV